MKLARHKETDMCAIKNYAFACLSGTGLCRPVTPESIEKRLFHLMDTPT
jgi:hypothetical protein